MFAIQQLYIVVAAFLFQFEVLLAQPVFGAIQCGPNAQAILGNGETYDDIDDLTLSDFDDINVGITKFSGNNMGSATYVVYSEQIGYFLPAGAPANMIQKIRDTCAGGGSVGQDAVYLQPFTGLCEHQGQQLLGIYPLDGYNSGLAICGIPRSLSTHCDHIYYVLSDVIKSFDWMCKLLISYLAGLYYLLG